MTHSFLITYTLPFFNHIYTSIRFHGNLPGKSLGIHLKSIKKLWDRQSFYLHLFIFQPWQRRQRSSFHCIPFNSFFRDVEITKIINYSCSDPFCPPSLIFLVNCGSTKAPRPKTTIALDHIYPQVIFRSHASQIIKTFLRLNMVVKALFCGFYLKNSILTGNKQEFCH